MMRDAIRDKEWFDKWIEFDELTIKSQILTLSRPSGNPSFRPQFIFEIASEYLHLLLRRYCRGDSVCELSRYFLPLLDAWEEAERLGKELWTPEQQLSRHSWRLNLDQYIFCFWLVGLALALEVPQTQWQRLLALVGNEGEDALLDSVIASRQPGRRIGSSLCHPKPYQLLWDAAKTPTGRRSRALADFVNQWYAGLECPPKAGLSRLTNAQERPYWYGYHTIDGAYFGYWCVEAVAASKAFKLDDSLCLGLPHYPGDLLRPEGPSTHPVPTVDVQARAEQSVAEPMGIKERLRKTLFELRTRE